MKKRSQRIASILVALPLMLAGLATLSAPAHASKYDSCELLPPQPREVDPVTGEPIGLPSAVYECNIPYAPPPAPTPVSNTHSIGVEVYASTKAYSPMADYYRVQAEGQRQQAVMMAWFIGAVSAASTIAMTLLVRHFRTPTGK